VRDPDECASPAGTIVTGAAREHVPPVFEPVLAAAAAEIGELEVPQGSVEPTSSGSDGWSLYLYGSVATGRARAGSSDVDLLAVGVATADADSIAGRLTTRFAGLCRSVDLAVVRSADLIGLGDEAYGNRVFLRHYCVHLAGADPVDATAEFAADARAARGFNGDIALHADRWRSSLASGAMRVDLSRDSVRDLGRVVARKSLLAVAGLVSIHDQIWTTDRVAAAQRWSRIDPSLADGLATLVGWLDGDVTPTRESVEDALDGLIAEIVAAFEHTIGLWG
jgi:hypothetical protein